MANVNGLPEENKIKPVPVPNMYSPSRPDMKPPGSRVDPAVATPFQKFGGRVTGDLAWAGKQMGETAAKAVGVAERIPGQVRDFWKWGNSVPGAAKDTARAAVQQVTGGGGGQSAPMGSALNRPQMTQGDNANVLASPNTPVIAPPPETGQRGSTASIPNLYTNRPEVAWDKGGKYLAREGGQFEDVAPGMGRAAFEQKFGTQGYQANPERRAEAASAAASSAASDRAYREEESSWEAVPRGGGGGGNSGGGDYGRRESVPYIPGLGDQENALIQAGMAYEKKGGFYARTASGNREWIPERIEPTGSASSMVNARANEEQNRVSRENTLTNAGVQSRGDTLRYRSDVGNTEQRREEAAAGRDVTREGYGYDILKTRMLAEAGLDKAGIAAGARQSGEGINEYEYGRLRSEALANDFGGELRNPDGTINEDKVANRLGTRGPASQPSPRSGTLPQAPGRGAGRWETRIGPNGQQQRRWLAQ